MSLRHEGLMSWALRALPWAALGLIYVALLFTDVMEVDAAQYASMAREMLESGQWLEVQHRHRPYLDKPPLHFWLSAASFGVFGVSNWAYKLPSLVFAVAGLWATYELARGWYGERVGRAAALVLGSSLAMLLMLHDVRTDTVLMGAVALALALWCRFLHTRRVGYLALGWAAAALAMLAKGPIGLMVPLLGVGAHLLIVGPRVELIRVRTWLIGLGVVGLLLAPMLYGLFRQYDLEGWRFYFYTQSFGRLTGDNTTWSNDGGLSTFFVHTFAWAILPWTFLFVGGFVLQAREAFRREAREWVTLAGFALPFVALSFSRYKLPHYIYVVLPLGAVMAGRALIGLLDGGGAGWRRAAVVGQLLIVTALWALLLVLVLWAFPIGWVGVGALLLIGLAATVALVAARGFEGRVVWAPVATMATLGVVCGLHLFPEWLRYHSSSAAAREWLAEPAARPPLFQLNTADHALEFYSRQIVPRLDSNEVPLDSVLALPQVWLYTDARGRDSVRRMSVTGIRREVALPHYPVQFLSWQFIDPARRAPVIETRWLLLLEPRPPGTPELDDHPVP